MVHLLVVLPALCWIVLHDRERSDRSMARRMEIGAGTLAVALWTPCVAQGVVQFRVVSPFCGLAPFATDALIGILLLRAFSARRAPPIAIAH